MITDILIFPTPVASRDTRNASRVNRSEFRGQKSRVEVEREADVKHYGGENNRKLTMSSLLDNCAELFLTKDLYEVLGVKKGATEQESKLPGMPRLTVTCMRKLMK